MRQVSVRDIGAEFERRLAEVESGETIEFVRDGKPVARLTAIVPNRRSPAEILASADYRRMLDVLERGVSPGGFSHDRPRNRDDLYDEFMNERGR